MNRAPAIPSAQGLPPAVKNVVEPMKEVLEYVTGRRPKLARITALPSDATLADVIAKVNEIIWRMQP